MAHSKQANELQLKTPLLIFGGCYSNLQATQALQNWANEHNIPPEQCICTGDIVAYCGNPYETVEFIRDWGVHCIQGNVEQSLANSANNCGCGFEEGSVCDSLSRGWYPIAEANITADQREWFAGLPLQLQISIEGQTLQVVHGAVSDINKFMYDSQSKSDFKKEFQSLEAEVDTIIAGHSGLPFTKNIEGKTWHNSGALGIPANDGTQDVWFSIVEIKDNNLVYQHHRLAYDVEPAYQEMIKHNLTQGYHESLKTGLWPSMDVLPEYEKQQQGIKINP